MKILFYILFVILALKNLSAQKGKVDSINVLTVPASYTATESMEYPINGGLSLFFDEGIFVVLDSRLSNDSKYLLMKTFSKNYKIKLSIISIKNAKVIKEFMKITPEIFEELKYYNFEFTIETDYINVDDIELSDILTFISNSNSNDNLQIFTNQNDINEFFELYFLKNTPNGNVTLNAFDFNFENIDNNDSIFIKKIHSNELILAEALEKFPSIQKKIEKDSIMYTVYFNEYFEEEINISHNHFSKLKEIESLYEINLPYRGFIEFFNLPHSDKYYDDNNNFQIVQYNIDDYQYYIVLNFRKQEQFSVLDSSFKLLTDKDEIYKKFKRILYHYEAQWYLENYSILTNDFVYIENDALYQLDTKQLNFKKLINVNSEKHFLAGLSYNDVNSANSNYEKVIEYSNLLYKYSNNKISNSLIIKQTHIKEYDLYQISFISNFSGNHYVLHNTKKNDWCFMQSGMSEFTCYENTDISKLILDNSEESELNQKIRYFDIDPIYNVILKREFVSDLPKNVSVLNITGNPEILDFNENSKVVLLDTVIQEKNNIKRCIYKNNEFELQFYIDSNNQYFVHNYNSKLDTIDIDWISEVYAISDNNRYLISPSYLIDLSNQTKIFLNSFLSSYNNSLIPIFLNNYSIIMFPINEFQYEIIDLNSENRKIADYYYYSKDDWYIVTKEGLYDYGTLSKDRLYYIYQNRKTYELEQFGVNKRRINLLDEIAKGGYRYNSKDALIENLEAKLPLEINCTEIKDLKLMCKIHVINSAQKAKTIAIRLNNSRKLQIENPKSEVEIDLNDLKEYIDFDGIPENLSTKDLVPTINQLDIRVYNTESSWEEVNITHNLENYYDKPTTTSINKRLTRKFYGIFVGVSEYKNKSLNFADDDAQAMYDLMKKVVSTSEGTYYSSNSSFYLLKNSDAKKDSILKIFKKIKEEARPTDVVLLYLSGHGVAKNGNFYYITYDYTDSNISQVESIDTKEDNLNLYLSGKDIQDFFKSYNDFQNKDNTPLKSNKNFLIIDACHAGAVLNEYNLKNLSESQQIRLNELAAYNGVNYITAAKADQKAIESDRYGHGFLTWGLIKKLSSTPIPNQMEFLTANWFLETTEFLDQVSYSVNNTKKTYTQKPVHFVKESNQVLLGFISNDIKKLLQLKGPSSPLYTVIFTDDFNTEDLYPHLNKLELLKKQFEDSFKQLIKLNNCCPVYYVGNIETNPNENGYIVKVFINTYDSEKANFTIDIKLLENYVEIYSKNDIKLQYTELEKDISEIYYQLMMEIPIEKNSRCATKLIK